MSNNARELTFVRVDVEKTLREKKTLQKELFLKEIVLSKAQMRNPKWKQEIGNKGLMLKSDFEAGLFHEYGLKADRITGNTDAKKLETANAEYQKQVAEMEAKVAEMEAKLAAMEQEPKKPSKKDKQITE